MPNVQLVSKAMRLALDNLAVAHPAWLRAERYARRAEEARPSKSQEEREERALMPWSPLLALAELGVLAW